jgi:hypothetical protein
MHFFKSLTITNLAIAVTAQTAQNSAAASLAAQIPSCVQPCDDNAIVQVGCALDDYACHCSHGTELSTLIPACLKNSTCSSADLRSKHSPELSVCFFTNSICPVIIEVNMYD